MRAQERKEKKKKEKQTGAVSDYALAQFVIAQPCEGVCRATDLERADFLQILAFEQQVDLGPVFGGRECGEGFRREDGGFMDTRLDELECFDDGGAGERKGSRRHCGLCVWGFGGLGECKIYISILLGVASRTCTYSRTVPPHCPTGYSTPACWGRRGIYIIKNCNYGD